VTDAGVTTEPQPSPADPEGGPDGQVPIALAAAWSTPERYWRVTARVCGQAGVPAVHLEVSASDETHIKRDHITIEKMVQTLQAIGAVAA
jgi:hypothetical protein